MRFVSARFVSSLAALVVLAAGSAHAQFPKLKNGSLALGGTGQFSTLLESSATNYTSGTSSYSNQNQYTHNSAGFVGSLQFNPVAWAGVELNYGYTHYTEVYGYQATGNLGTTAATTRIGTDAHEATAAYIYHVKKFKYQPYVGIGGGAIDFNPLDHGDHQWRGAGLLETGFDFAVPQTGHHLSFRVAGRSLYYRSPNFATPAISTRSWRVTEEPYVAAVYRF